MLYAAQVRVWIFLHGATERQAYPLLVGSVALLLTLSMTIPFASILVASVLLRRDRWKEIVLLSSLGSAVGGLLLYVVFHRLGWSFVIEAYPDLVQSKAWVDATRWVTSYGAWALLAVAATPLPQSPALIFTAVSELPAAQVFFALLLGKVVKYGIYAWLASAFPDWFQHLLGRWVSAHANDLVIHAKGMRS